MRILHLDTGAGWRGGQQQVVWLMQGLRRHGLEQALAARWGSALAERLRREGFEVIELGPRPLCWANLRLVRGQAGRFDLLHAHDSHAHSLAWIAQWGQRGRKPPLVVSRRVAFPIGFFSLPKYSAANAFIAVSDYVRQRLQEAGVPASKIRVILDGVPPPSSQAGTIARAEFRRHHGCDEETFLLGTVTSLAPEKMPEAAINLLAELPSHVHFWLARPAAETGAPDAENALIRQVRQKGLQQRFRIFSLEEDVQGFLASLDVFVYLSRMEGLGSAILLAMAHGLPVIASEVGGIPEIVRHQQTGLLVSGSESAELSAVVRLLLNSPDLRQRLASAGREFVLAHATDAIMVAQTAALYRELISPRGPRSQ